jgi:hypothetical protein
MDRGAGLGHVITVRDRKWARTVEYADKAQTLEAAGLQEQAGAAFKRSNEVELA